MTKVSKITSSAQEIRRLLEKDHLTREERQAVLSYLAGALNSNKKKTAKLICRKYFEKFDAKRVKSLLENSAFAEDPKFERLLDLLEYLSKD